LPIDVAILDADRGRPLMHGVLEKVRAAVLAIALRERAESILERRGHARHAMILDQHDPKPVLEHELVRAESEERPVFRAQRRSGLRARSSALPEKNGAEAGRETEDDHTRTRHMRLLSSSAGIAARSRAGRQPVSSSGRMSSNRYSRTHRRWCRPGN